MLKFLDQNRRRFALIFTILMGCLVLFTIFIQYEMSNIRQTIEYQEEYRQEQIEEFRNYNLWMNQNFLNSIEESWTQMFENEYFLEQKDDMTNEEIIDYFTTSYSDAVEDLAQFHYIAIEYQGEIVYTAFNDEEYVDITPHNFVHEDNEEESLFVYENEKVEQKTIKEIAYEDFVDNGQLYYNSRNIGQTLDGRLMDITVYVGFMDNVVMEEFIDSLDIEQSRWQGGRLRNVTRIITAFMVIIILIGVYLLFKMNEFFKIVVDDHLAQSYSSIIIGKFLGDDEGIKDFLQEELDELDMDANLTVEQLMNKLNDYLKGKYK